MSAPVFLLAFAYDPTAALPQVSKELKTIQNQLEQTDGTPRVIWQVTPDELATAFDIHRRELMLFHYSGHASPDGLLLNKTGEGASRITLGTGLARQAGRAKGLRLVFLNGCSTREQAQTFLNQGVAAVIATTKPLLDRYGLDFARRFYQSFTRRRGLNTLQEAFEEAFILFTDANGQPSPEMFEENSRGNLDLDQDSGSALYELFLHPDKKNIADQRFEEWLEEQDALQNPAANEPSNHVQSDKKEEIRPSTPPPTMGIKGKIQDLVGQGRLEDALNELVKVSPDAILLKGQFASAKRENNMGIMESGDWQRTLNRLNNAVLEIAQSL